MDGGRLTINGDKVKLHGHNRHTMRPDTGSALTLEQVRGQQVVALCSPSFDVSGAR
jgi:beta-galactosidase/beta-glucuronidase